MAFTETYHYIKYISETFFAAVMVANGKPSLLKYANAINCACWEIIGLETFVVWLSGIRDEHRIWKINSCNMLID